MATSTFATFDDASSTLSNREDFLLVLISSLSGATTQSRNQKRALTMIEACGVQPEVLDAADPANTLVRDELCEMSGIRGIYPQLFLVQGDKTSFFADFDELEHMNEEGTLAEWLSMELPIAKPQSENYQMKDMNTCTKLVTPDGHTHDSQSNSSRDRANGNSSEGDNENASSSTSEDLFNFTSVSKVLNSMSINSSDSDTKLQNQGYYTDDKDNARSDDNNNMKLSIPKVSKEQDEWSNPLLQEQYEDEILALEDFLDDEGVLLQHKDGNQDELVEQKRERESVLLLEGVGLNDLVSGAQAYGILNKKSSIFHDMDQFSRPSEMKRKNGDRSHHQNMHNYAASSSSIVTTPTVTPTSSPSLSPSPDTCDIHEQSDIGEYHSPLTSPNNRKSDRKESSSITSMEMVSTRSENEQLLRAEVQELRQKCEKLTAERYIMEGQLREARQRNNRYDQESSDKQNIDTVNKFQLRQIVRCAGCMKVFNSNPSSMYVPIASQACGHSICRNCCQKRLSAVRRHRDEITMNSSERLRNTISSDLFMCGMGNMSQVYSPSFEEHQRQLQECEACPICCAPKAFRQGKLQVNESLCLVLKLLEN